IKSPSSRRARAQCPLVLPDIPEKISLEDWSIKACYIEDMVYPSPRNCSYLTSSCTAAFMEPSRWEADSESSLLLSSLTESSSIGSLPVDQSDAYRKVVRSVTPMGAGLQCRRNENPDVLVVMGTAKFPCHRAVLSMHSQYFQRILGVNPRSQKASTNFADSMYASDFAGKAISLLSPFGKFRNASKTPKEPESPKSPTQKPTSQTRPAPPPPARAPS
ncbi:unnamed protein product, partial [Ixodes persulcatus]